MSLEMPANDEGIETGLNFSGHTILIADDLGIDREIMAAILEKTGVGVDFAENGKIAFSLFEENPDKYRLIFMDVNMPQMDGYEATQAIRSIDAAQAEDVRIIAIIANDHRDIIERCLAAGMDDHITKPVAPHELYEKLKKYLPAKKIRGKLKNGIEWSEEYELDNELVDNQHYQMFEMLSELVGACRSGTDVKILKDTLDFLVNYTVKHFEDEEALQIQYNYPEYENHRKLHKEFKITISELVQRFMISGSSSELSNDVNKIVVKWLVNHIQYEDKKIGEHIRKTARTA